MDLPSRTVVLSGMQEVTDAQTAAWVNRLAQLIRLLSSNQAGEVAAAASAITRMLNEKGLDWHELAKVIEVALTTPVQKNHSRAPSYRSREEEPVDNDLDFWIDLIEDLLAVPRLRNKEREFLESMVSWTIEDGRLPTPKQAKWLRDIAHQKGSGVHAWKDI
jgi:hypothetical protein